MTAQQSPEALLDAKVVAAYSSLTNFSCEFDNGKGLRVDAIRNPSGQGAAKVRISVVTAAELERAADAVCRVDWTWIYGKAVLGLLTYADAAQLELSDIGKLTVSAQMWQDKPFLAFQPYRPAK